MWGTCRQQGKPGVHLHIMRIDEFLCIAGIDFLGQRCIGAGIAVII
jgi:hypothetical protein